MAERKVATSFAALIAEADFTLPSQADSGVLVRLRKPNVIQLFHEGNVVDLLSPLVEGWIQGKSKTAKAQHEAELVLDLLKAVPELEPRLNTVVAATMIEPRGNAEEVAGLSIRDRVAVLLWALGEEFGDLQGMFRRLTEQSQRLQSVGEIPTVA
jgi:hypothetical protein